MWSQVLKAWVPLGDLDLNILKSATNLYKRTGTKISCKEFINNVPCNI